VSFLSGPPRNAADDSRVVSEYMAQEGLHIVSGGTSAEIVARELGKKLEVNMDDGDESVPPTGKIEGVDLVTEGVLTLKAALELFDEYIKKPAAQSTIDALDRNNGASRLARILIERCTDLHLFIGRTVNAAHQNSDFPTELRLKFRLLDDIAARMTVLGRNVVKQYY
jgi:hypothetical protein